MYINELLDAYKYEQRYIQDKQIAHDLNVLPNIISKMRKGVRYVTDEEAIFLAEGAGIDPEIALLGCHADRNDNPNVKAMWANIAKKYNGIGFQGVTAGLLGIVVAKDSVINPISQCVLSILC